MHVFRPPFYRIYTQLADPQRRWIPTAQQTTGVIACVGSAAGTTPTAAAISYLRQRLSATGSAAGTTPTAAGVGHAITMAKTSSAAGTCTVQATSYLRQRISAVGNANASKVFTDDFNRASIGSNYTNIDNATLRDNKLSLVLTDYAYAFVNLTDVAWEDNLQIKADVTLGLLDNSVALFLKEGGGGAGGYASIAVSRYSSTQVSILLRYSVGGSVYSSLQYLATWATADTKTVMFRLVGQMLYGYVNGAQVVSYDATGYNPLAGDNIGIELYHDYISGDSAKSTYVDNLEVTELAGGCVATAHGAAIVQAKTSSITGTSTVEAISYPRQVMSGAGGITGPPSEVTAHGAAIVLAKTSSATGSTPTCSATSFLRQRLSAQGSAAGTSTVAAISYRPTVCLLIPGVGLVEFADTLLLPGGGIVDPTSNAKKIVTRATPSGWLQETASNLSRATPFGWVQETTGSPVSQSWTNIQSGAGSAAGAVTVTAYGLALTQAKSSAAAGTSTVAATSSYRQRVSEAGSATGTSTVTAHGAFLSQASGSAAGTATAEATSYSRQRISAVGNAGAGKSFTDDFNRTSLGSNYTTDYPPELRNNKLSLSLTNYKTGEAILADATWADDIQIKADVTLGCLYSEAEFVARGGSGDFVRVTVSQYNETQVRLTPFHYVEGTYHSTYGDVGWLPSDTKTVKFVALGAMLYCYVNDALIVSFDTSSYGAASGGQVSIDLYHHEVNSDPARAVYVDNLEITELAGGCVATAHGAEVVPAKTSSATGTSTADAVSLTRARISAEGSATGAATATAHGAWTVYATGAADCTSTTAATSYYRQRVAESGSAAGTSTVSAASQATQKSVGSAAGTSDAQAISDWEETVDAVGSVEGTAIATAYGVAITLAKTSAAAGTSTTEATSYSRQRISASGSADGTSTTTAHGAWFALAKTSSSSGTSTADATSYGRQRVSATGDAAGTSTVEAHGVSFVLAKTSTATGTSTVAATSSPIKKATGASSGASTAEAFSEGSNYITAVGAASGTASVAATGVAFALAKSSSAAGVSTVAATSALRQRFSEVGSAAGTSTCAAVSEDTNAPDVSLRVSFPTPSYPPKTGVDGQRFRVLVRRDATYPGSANPTVDVYLYEDGVQVGSALVSAESVTSNTGQIIEAFWDAASLTYSDGSRVECYIVGHHAGARTVEIGAVEWDVRLGAHAVSGTGSSAGASTVTAYGVAVTLAKSSAASCTSTVEATSQPIKKAVGAAYGSAEGLAISDWDEATNAYGSAAGTAGVTAYGVAFVQAKTSSAAGTSTVAAVSYSRQRISAQGSAAGTAGVSAKGIALFPASGSASGTSTVAATSQARQRIAATGSAAGTSTVQAVGVKVALAKTSVAAGTCTATAVSKPIFGAVGSATGTSVAAADSYLQIQVSGTGSAAGTSTATAKGVALVEARTSTATGTSTVAAVSAAQTLIRATGSAAGTSTVTATSHARQVLSGAGSATGSVLVAAVSQVLHQAVGVAEGASTAAAFVSVLGTATVTVTSVLHAFGEVGTPGHIEEDLSVTAQFGRNIVAVAIRESSLSAQAIRGLNSPITITVQKAS